MRFSQTGVLNSSPSRRAMLYPRVIRFDNMPMLAG